MLSFLGIKLGLESGLLLGSKSGCLVLFLLLLVVNLVLTVLLLVIENVIFIFSILANDLVLKHLLEGFNV